MASQEDVSFRCKMCQFMAKSKVDIADHFMEIHAVVEVVDSNDPQLSALNQNESPEVSNTGDDGIKKEATTSPEKGQPQTKVQTTLKSRPGFRGNAIRSTISHLVRAAEQASQGTSKSRVPPTVTVKYIGKAVNVIGRELRKHKRKRKYEDFVMYNDDVAKSKKAKLTTATNGNGSKTSTPVVKGKQVKKQESAEKIAKIKVKDFKVLTLSISGHEFTAKSEEQLKVWLDNWTEKNIARMDKCDSENCSVEIDHSETGLHKRCHIKNYYGFRCPHCDYMHSRWRNMRCHVYNMHKERPLLRCDWPGCTEAFTIIVGLKRHVQRDHIQQKLIKEYTPGQVESQDKQVEEKPVGEDANDIEQQPTKVDGCVVVEKSIKLRKKKESEQVTVADLKKRKRRRFQPIPWRPTCSVCEAKYIALDKLDVHMALHAVTEGEEKVKCTECGIVTDDKSSLKAHMKKCHQRLLKVYRCDLCKYAGDRQFDYQKHMLTHGDTKLCMCEVCGKLMSTVYNLKVHRLRVHATEKEKTIHCQHCSYRCANIIVLKDHMRFQHNLMWNGDLYKNAEKLLTYKCDLCSYVGKKEKSLKFHMRVHTENRQFPCNLCSYASKTKNNLFLHMRTHGGMKPFKCPHCDYRGATNKVVNEHVLSKHACTRPFRCPCGWSTSYSGNMWKHVQQHREKEDGYRMVAEKMYGSRKSKKGETAKKMGDVKEESLSNETVIAIVQDLEEGVEGQEELQLDSLAQAVCLAADKDSVQHVDGPEASHLQTTQAANFLSKLAHAVSTGQVDKQMPDGKVLRLECDEQTTEGADQTIEELVLW